MEEDEELPSSSGSSSLSEAESEDSNANKDNAKKGSSVVVRGTEIPTKINGVTRRKPYAVPSISEQKKSDEDGKSDDEVRRDNYSLKSFIFLTGRMDSKNPCFCIVLFSSRIARKRLTLSYQIFINSFKVASKPLWKIK
jgi:hypothetical protein